MSMFQFTKDDVMYFIELGVMTLLGFVVLLMVVRPLMKRALAADPAMTAKAALPAPSDTSAVPASAGAALGQLTSGAHARPSMVDVAQVQGQVHAQSVHRVGELAEQNPTETASIIRQWLAEPA